jgi:predicted XRE-type DNA-binding protein
MKAAVEVKESSGNVFADLGLDDSAGLLAKAELVRQIAVLVARRHLTQAETAAILGTTQPKVSDLLRGRLAGFSIERIIRFLNALDRDVEIVVTPKHRRHGPARFWVAPEAPPRRSASRARRAPRASAPRRRPSA